MIFLLNYIMLIMVCSHYSSNLRSGPPLTTSERKGKERLIAGYYSSANWISLGCHATLPQYVTVPKACCEISVSIQRIKYKFLSFDLKIIKTRGRRLESEISSHLIDQKSEESSHDHKMFLKIADYVI